MNLLLSATAEEVQKATGYNLSEWDKFLRFTRKEAEELARTYPNRVWANYTTNEQEKVKERINKKLADNSIAQVGSTVIRWRMARCVRDVKHSKIGSGAAPPTASTKTGTPAREFWDPIRDV